MLTQRRWQGAIVWNLEAAMVMLLMCSGDVERNPGPSYPCTVCHKVVGARQQGIECSKYERWTHA